MANVYPKVYPDGAIVSHHFADGTECHDWSTCERIKSPDAFSDLTKRLAFELMRQGAEIRRRAAAGG